MNIPGVGNLSNRTPLDNNRPSSATRSAGQVSVGETAPIATDAEATARPERRVDAAFADRRTSPDRRKKNKKPLVDTRRAGDRRRSKVDVTV